MVCRHVSTATDSSLISKLFNGVVIDQFNRIKVVTVRPRPIVDF